MPSLILTGLGVYIRRKSPFHTLRMTLGMTYFMHVQPESSFDITVNTLHSTVRLHFSKSAYVL
jgi:hypothetical protein